MFKFIKKKDKSTEDKPTSSEEDKDFYIENGLYVFTASYHKKRGYCCGNGCRHCPYPANEKKL